MRTADDIDRMAGAYRLAPGHGLSGTRPLLAAGRLAQVLRDRPASSVPDTIASLFTICGHAHRRAARQALAAAANSAPADEGSATLTLETARDHLRTIALEWPQRMVPGPAPVQLEWLRECPLRISGAPVTSERAAASLLQDFSAWLEQGVLRQAPADWLSEHEDAQRLASWCRERDAQLQPAACLAALHPLLARWQPAARCLVLDANAAARDRQLRELGATLMADPLFVQQPTWRGLPAENGPWARRRGGEARAWLQGSAWTRLGSRWIELVELAAAAREPSPGEALRCGALPLEEGAAIGWCEMARGTLFHLARLDRDGLVRDWLVLAPTEWNFHPCGALARCIESLPATDASDALALAAAFDPCVPCTLEP